MSLIRAALVAAALVAAALAHLGCEDEQVDLVAPPPTFEDAAVVKDAPSPDAAPEL